VRNRWIWAAVALVAIAAGVAALLWSTAGSGAKFDAIITAIHPDGTVEWDEAVFVKAPENNSIAEPVPGSHGTARLAEDIQIYTAVGDWCANQRGPGMGRLDPADACTRAEFMAIKPDVLYAVQIEVDDDGGISLINEYYHP